MLPSDKVLRIISRAWGRNQEGYCFFPWIDRDEQAKEGVRRAGFHEGSAFQWPQDKDKIIAHLDKHRDHDLYWCPSLFEYPTRRTDLATDEHSLWADLDSADPRLIQDYPPTIAWETSPGRYQALWIIASGDIQGASWPGNENQRLTYHIGADQSGWDTTQLLRLPGWNNYKYDYREDGQPPPQGKLLWDNGRTYLPDEFEELPDIKGALPTNELAGAIEDEIAALDRHEVLARVRLKLTKRCRELIGAREAVGDRSDALWEMERSLADAGCTVAEIVVVVKSTVWNKFDGRADELKRLILEASKALQARPEKVEERLEEERLPKAAPGRFATLLANVKKPVWLIEEVLTEGAVGFVAGQPKSYKSWVGLDAALSVATGSDFLGHFRVMKPGPVLYIQEEDPPIILKDRTIKIWSGKMIDQVKLEDKDVFWLPGKDNHEFDPNVNAYIQQGLIISDGAWQEWLDETLANGMETVSGLVEPYSMMVIDTLMMVAGDVDENRAQEMTTKIFKPLKVLARKHNVAVWVVHHMRKGGGPGQPEQRGGQMLLGSVANHAWSEDSMYLTLARNGDIQITTESKSYPGNIYRLGNIRNTRWEPSLSVWKSQEQEKNSEKIVPRSRTSVIDQMIRVMNANGGGPFTTSQVATLVGKSNQQTIRNLKRAVEMNTIDHTNNLWAVSNG